VTNAGAHLVRDDDRLYPQRETTFPRIGAVVIGAPVTTDVDADALGRTPNAPARSTDAVKLVGLIARDAKHFGDRLRDSDANVGAGVHEHGFRHAEDVVFISQANRGTQVRLQNAYQGCLGSLHAVPDHALTLGTYVRPVLESLERVWVNPGSEHVGNRLEVDRARRFTGPTVSGPRRRRCQRGSSRLLLRTRLRPRLRLALPLCSSASCSSLARRLLFGSCCVFGSRQLLGSFHLLGCDGLGLGCWR
jgi:hypothetical protein